jgi:hypothetical protein
MSIIVSYRRITPEKFTELQTSPEVAEEFFYGDIDVYTDDLEASDSQLSIEKE